MSLVRDERVPASRKALLAVAGAYVLSPIDFVPDWLPLVGGLDDVLVVVLAVEAFLAGLPPKLIDEKLDELGIPRGSWRRTCAGFAEWCPAAAPAIAARIPDAHRRRRPIRQTGVDILRAGLSRPADTDGG